MIADADLLEELLGPVEKPVCKWGKVLAQIPDSAREAFEEGHRRGASAQKILDTARTRYASAAPFPSVSQVRTHWRGECCCG